jgi:hypothetical protein
MEFKRHRPEIVHMGRMRGEMGLYEHRELRDGEPCGHPGCLSHRTHPCEGCGRVGGMKEGKMDKELEPIYELPIVRALQQENSALKKQIEELKEQVTYWKEKAGWEPEGY